jgi:hypothetical protein
MWPATSDLTDQPHRVYLEWMEAERDPFAGDARRAATTNVTPRTGGLMLLARHPRGGLGGSR